MSHKLLLSIPAVAAFGLVAHAQHDGDIAVGRTGADQLTTLAYDPNVPCFDPRIGVGLFDRYPSDPNLPPESYRTTNPGFDANFASYPERDFYQLEPGATVYLVAAENFPAGFTISYGSSVLRNAGDRLLLGSNRLHRHCVFKVDCADPGWDPLRVIWFGRVHLKDEGSTGYASSEPFVIRLATVECQTGDVSGDGAVNFADISPFVRVLGDPGSATEKERCAADCNVDGSVNFADINPFVALLSGARTGGE